MKGKKMIYTITFNPSLDYIVEVEKEYVESFSIPREKDTQLDKAIELLSKNLT